MDAPDYHFADSCWRFNFPPIFLERDPQGVHRMMYHALLEFVHRFGPIGQPGAVAAEVRQQGLRLADAQLDRLVLWLERNSALFKTETDRAELRALRDGGEAD